MLMTKASRLPAISTINWVNREKVKKLIEQASKNIPGSGSLYNELGELLWAQKNNEAVKQWEKGIESDPNFSRITTMQANFITKIQMVFGVSYMAKPS
jgi:tetratricopeptide (TPR) repeat protein